MKDTWELIEQTVAVAPLTKEQKPRVLDALDRTLGENMIESEFPIDEPKALDESEFVVYREILEALNEAKSIISSEKDYEEAIKQVMQKKGKDLSSTMLRSLNAMDDAFKEGDWLSVNKHWKSIKVML